MRKISILAAGLLVAGAFATQAFAKSKTVNVNNDFFKPKTVTVKKNDTVKFKFNGFHNVKADGKRAFADIPDRSSGTVSRKAKKKGNFNLVCTLHDGMTMKLKVK